VLRLMVTVGDVATANVFRDRLEKLEPRIREDSCAIPWVYCARGYWSTYVEWDPASALTSYLAELPHFERTGDVVNHRITRAHVGWVLQWFGAYEESERTLAAVAAEPDGTGFIHDFSRLYLGRTLALLGRHDEARVLEQAVCASFISAQNHLFAGLAHVHLAEIETLAGKAEAAASSAATAADMLKTAPPLRASALGWTARARLALGDAAGALVAAQEAVAITDSLGVFFEGEIRLRVALADALEGVGRGAEARLALQQVKGRLETLAASIIASEYRVRFVERIPENARVLGLSPASSDRSAPPGA